MRQKNSNPPLHYLTCDQCLYLTCLLLSLLLIGLHVTLLSLPHVSEVLLGIRSPFSPQMLFKRNLPVLKGHTTPILLYLSPIPLSPQARIDRKLVNFHLSTSGNSFFLLLKS